MSSARVLKLSVFSVAAVMLLAAVIFILGNPVSALSRWEPHEPDFTTSPEQTWSYPSARNMRFVTDKTGAQAWKSVVAVYSRTTTVSITIKDAVHCSDNHLFPNGVGGDYDGLSGVTTYFSLEPYAPAAPTSAFGPVVVVTDCSVPGAPGSRDLTIVRDISGNSQSTVIGGITWYRSKVRADMSVSGGGSNTFEVVANDPGALVSYYSESGNDFVLQDRGDNAGTSPPRLTDYHLKFGTECSVTNNTRARLDWFDDDRWGNNRDAAFNYRMELIERTRAGALTGVRYYLNFDGSHNFIATTRWTGNQVGGWADFTAKPDHKYELIWHGVQLNNAIQFQLPFDSIYYNYGCDQGSWDYGVDGTIAGGSPTAERKTVQRGQSFTINSLARNYGDGAGMNYAQATRPANATHDSRVASFLTLTSANRTGTHYYWGSNGALAKAGSAGDRRNRAGSYTVNDGSGGTAAAADGTVICFYTRINPSGGTSVPLVSNSGAEDDTDICVTISGGPYWSYVPTIQPISDTRAGDRVDVTSITDNIGTQTGPAITYTRIHSWENESYLNVLTDASGATVGLGTDPINNDAGWDDLGTLNTVDTIPHTGTWGVDKDTPAGTIICFRASVAPGRGVGSTIVAATEMNPDPPPTPGVCFEVLSNERYAMEAEVTGPSASNPAVLPGGIATFDVDVWNQGDYTARGLNANFYPNAKPGPARGINCTFATGSSVPNRPGTTVLDDASGNPPSCFGSPDYDAAAFDDTVEVRVSPDAQIGDLICLDVAGTALNGFSYNTHDAQERFEDSICYVVGIQPYVHVWNGDVWAGANFDPGTSYPEVISPCGPAGSNIDSEVRGVMSLLKGSFVDYAAFATGDISGFGTAGVENRDLGLNLGDKLTYQNNSTPYGNFTSTTRCIHNYFDLMYGVGTSRNGSSVNIQSLSAGQYYWPAGNSLTIGSTGAAIDGDDDITIVVDGDIYIDTGGGPNKTIVYDQDYSDLASLNIPSLVIVAKGSIYLNQDLRELDALLISHDTVWTCATGLGAPVQQLAKDTCQEPLTINGAIIASRVNFMRTHEGTASSGAIVGGYHDGSSGPAEIINFSPEFFLSEPIFETIVGNKVYYKTEQTKDLPPLY